MHKTTKIFALALFSIFSLLFLNNCFLDGTGRVTSRPSHPIGEPGNELSWSADAFPGYVCPADDIFIKWNVGDPMCPDGTGPECQRLTVTNSVGYPEFTSTALSGEHNMGSLSEVEGWVSANPLFYFSVDYQEDVPLPELRLPWDNRNSYVEVIADSIGIISIDRPFRAGSACNNSSCRWRLDEYRLNMQDQSFLDATKGLGSCVRIRSICYRTDRDTLEPGEQRPGRIAISVINSRGTRNLGSVDEGGCIEDINLRHDLEYVITPDVPLLQREEGTCCEGSGPVGSELTINPFIELTFTLGCNTTSDECT